MALIDYPDVPISPGVPNVRRAVTAVATRTGLLGTLQSFDQFGILDGLLSQVYGVYTEDGNVAIEADTIESFRYRGEEKIATHPVEGGGFASYNKVTMPYDSEMIITCNGQGDQSRAQILSTLEGMKTSLDTFDLVTPDRTYGSANLVSYDYSRRANSGNSILIVSMRFQEVRDTATSRIAVAAQPSGAAPVSVGTVKPLDPSKPELAIFNDSVFM